MIRLNKIFDDKIIAIPNLIGGSIDTRKVKGQQILDLYHNVFLCARKKSGKTSCIFKIIKECCNKDTIVVIFCSTIYKDAGWQNIRKYLDMKKIEHIDHTSIKSLDGVDQLESIINELQLDAEQEEKDKLNPVKKEPKKVNPLLCGDDEDDLEITCKRKSKYRVPDYLFIMDDISNELKSKSLIGLLKKNRHFKATCLISSQYVLDLDPQSRKQVDTWMIFRGQTLEKLQIIYKEADISIPFDEFLEIYRKATETPFSFLNINTREDTFKKNFNISIELK